MNEIIIIGTDPPCPRCGLLTAAVKSLVEELHIDAEISHLAYTDNKAAVLAAGFDLEPGTAKNVADKTGNPIDQEAMRKALDAADPNNSNEFSIYNKFNWKPELDEFLRTWETAAEDEGIMMTPVLIINGEKKHQGSVPPLDSIRQWLKGLE